MNELPDNVLEENILLQKDNRISRRRTRVDYCSRVHGHPLDVDIQTLRSEQKADETLKGLWRKVEKGDTGFLVEDGLLWRLAKDRMGDETTQLCLPASFRSMVLSLAHRPGHLGRDRTTQRILDDYFWPGCMLMSRNYAGHVMTVSVQHDSINHQLLYDLCQLLRYHSLALQWI